MWVGVHDGVCMMGGVGGGVDRGEVGQPWWGLTEGVEAHVLPYCW